MTSATIKRVVRGTLSAEANAGVEGADAVQHLRMLIFELRGNTVDLRTSDEDASAAVSAAIFTDADSVTRTLDSENVITDRRTRPLISQLRQLNWEYGLAVNWTDTQLMLADPLTKIKVSPDFLIQAVKSGAWSAASTVATIAAKERIREGRHRRKEGLRNLPDSHCDEHDLEDAPSSAEDG